MLDEWTDINEINRQTYNDDIHDVANVSLLKYYWMDQTYWKLIIAAVVCNNNMLAVHPKTRVILHASGYLLTKDIKKAPGKTI